MSRGDYLGGHVDAAATTWIVRGAHDSRRGVDDPALVTAQGSRVACSLGKSSLAAATWAPASTRIGNPTMSVAASNLAMSVMVQV